MMEPVEKLPEMPIEYLDSLAQTLRDGLPDNSCRSQLGLILYSQLRKRWMHTSWELAELLFENILSEIPIDLNSRNEVLHFVEHREYELALESLHYFISMSSTIITTKAASNLERLRKFLGLEPSFVARHKGDK